MHQKMYSSALPISDPESKAHRWGLNLMIDLESLPKPWGYNIFSPVVYLIIHLKCFTSWIGAEKAKWINIYSGSKNCPNRLRACTKHVIYKWENYPK